MWNFTAEVQDKNFETFLKISTTKNILLTRKFILLVIQTMSGAVGGQRTGVVHWYDVRKGYGFIIPNDESLEVFVHAEVIGAKHRHVRGKQVEFMSRPTFRGIEATSITGIDGAPLKTARKTSKFKGTCYNCLTKCGHRAKDCPSGPLPRHCFVCKEDDHLKINCPWITPACNYETLQCKDCLG